MKKSFFLVLIFVFFASSVISQKKLYLPDNSFKFKLSQFKMPLFEKQGIVGMFKEFLLVRTSIENTLTLLLVDKEGNIIENFERDWSLPQNWQDENGFWLYEAPQSLSGSTIVNVLKYNFSTRKKEVKSIEIPEYYQYSEFKPTISGDYFLCLNLQREIFLIGFTNWKITKITTRNHDIISFSLDNKTKNVNIFELAYSSSEMNIKFYQVPINEDIDFNKHLKWTKDRKALKVKRLYDNGNPNISFVASNEFIIKYAQFEDTLTISAKYDLEGTIISNFRLTKPQNLKFVSNNLGYDYYQISHLNNSWFLTNSGLASIIYQTNGPEKAINLKNQNLVQIPDNLQSTSNKYFVFSDSTNTLLSVNALDSSIQEHSYTIPEAEKSYNITGVHTLADGSYWIYYSKPGGTYIKYNSSDEEVYRTPDSLRVSDNNNGFYQLNNSDVLIATYDLESTDQCTNCTLTINRYLKVDGKNQSAFIETKKHFQGKPIYYYDNTRQHFYIKTDSLIRYSSDFKIDSSFHVEKNIQVGSMLVSKQGNIYLGKALFNYGMDSLYRLNSRGKVIWRKKYLLGEPTAYSQETSDSPWGGFYPLFNKDSIIAWGVLYCGEGCYTSNNIAFDENDKPIKLTYLEKRENNGPAYFFIDKYGVFMKNGYTFLFYNSIKKAIEKDTNTLIKAQVYYGSISGIDVLPNQDLLVIESNKLRKYSYKKTIWASIDNLEKERESNSHSFWNLYVADAINKQIKLDVFISDSSQAVLKIIPENSDIAYLKDHILFFTGKEGKIAIHAQSINGGEPYISPQFTVQRGYPPFSINVDGGAIYPNRAVVLKFESTENISFKIDSLQGSCKIHEDKLVSTAPFSENCKVYYSWTGTDIYAYGNAVLSVGVLEYLFIPDEEVVKNTILFPNPLTHNILSIKSPKEHIALIKITNMQGQKTELIMFQSNFQSGRFISNFEINKNFTPGIYIVELFDNQRNVIKKEKLYISR